MQILKVQSQVLLAACLPAAVLGCCMLQVRCLSCNSADSAQGVQGRRLLKCPMDSFADRHVYESIEGSKLLAQMSSACMSAVILTIAPYVGPKDTSGFASH